MNQKMIRVVLAVGILLLAPVRMGLAAQQDKYSVAVPNGLGMADFRGYEDWEPVAPSLTDATHVIRVIVANPTMIAAYKSGVPGNGKPFPDGSKIAKIEWLPQSVTTAPFSAAAPDTVAGPLKEVEFIEKDSKKFSGTHGWGYAAFNYDDATSTFSPVSATDKPPQGHDATCGAACHNIAAAKDFIFTGYPKR